MLDPLTHLLFAGSTLAAVIAGLLTGVWEPALGLGIAWAFLTLTDLIWP